MTTPRIFVSHSKEDNAFGIALVKDLRRVLDDKSAVWYDAKQGLNPGDEWFLKIENEIAARDTFIIILSPDAMNSKWVRREYDIALNENKKIIPFLYLDCQVWASLKTIHHVSFLPPKRYAEAFAELLTALGLPKRSLTRQKGELAGAQVAREEQAHKAETSLRFLSSTDSWRDWGVMSGESIVGKGQVQSTQNQSFAPSESSTPERVPLETPLAVEIFEMILEPILYFIDDIEWGPLSFCVFDSLFISITLNIWQKNWWIFFGSLLCSVILLRWGRSTYSTGLGYLLTIIFTIAWGFIAWLIASAYVGSSEMVGLFQATIPYISVSVGSQPFKITWGEVSAGALSLVAILSGFNIHKFFFRSSRVLRL